MAAAGLPFALAPLPGEAALGHEAAWRQPAREEAPDGLPPREAA